MGKRLILTEKPSVARDFAAAIGGLGKHKGYFEGDADIVTFCFGHLLELKFPEDYSESYKIWSVDDLPIIPERFEHRPISSSRAQLKVIHDLLKRSDVTSIVMATDAGREGELIGRLVLNYCGWRDWDAVRRFWVSEALTPAVVEKGLGSLKESASLIPLYESGRFRQQADWLAGINFSRFYSVRLSGRFSFGRVQSSVLGLIVQRDREIAEFVPSPYWEVIGRFSKGDEVFQAKAVVDEDSHRFDSQDRAETIAEQAGTVAAGKVTSAVREEKTKKPPKLLNLTALQRIANTKFGFSADKTLKIAQTLYEEKKVLSYPRTPSRVLGASDTALVADLRKSLEASYPELFARFKDELVDSSNKHVFNDAQLEDHHALLPLAPAPEDLSKDEKAIYNTVLLSFCQVFWPDEQFATLNVEIDAGGVTFSAKGKSTIDAGWRAIGAGDTAENTGQEDGDEEPSGSLPYLRTDDVVDLGGAEVQAKETRPPAAFTEASLLAAMENPGKFQKHKDDAKFESGVGLGTQATRAEIIETLIKREYVVREKKKIRSADKGFHFYDAVVTDDAMARFIEVDETARWEKVLKDRPVAFYEEVRTFVDSALGRMKGESFTVFKKEREQVGICPKCGAPIYESKKNFYCSAFKENGCDFTIWKSFIGGNITKSSAQKILAGRKTGKLKLKSKKGKEFEARVFLGEEHRLELEFDS